MWFSAASCNWHTFCGCILRWVIRELQRNRNVFRREAGGQDINQLQMQNTVPHLPSMWKTFNVSNSLETVDVSIGGSLVLQRSLVFRGHEFHADTPAPSQTLASNDITGVRRQHLYPEYFAFLFKSGWEIELPPPSSYTVSHYWPGEPSPLVATWHSGQLFVSIQLNSRIFSSLFAFGFKVIK